MIKLFPHNQIIYDEIVEKFKTVNMLGLVQATGLGKGYIATKMALEYFKGKNVLILAPRDTTLKHYKMNLNVGENCKIQLMTYSKLMNLSMNDLTKIAQRTAFVVFDEYHRTGAEKWGVAVGSLISLLGKYNKKCLGLTATEKRYLDSCRDMTEELFNGVKVEGPNVLEGVVRGILPNIIYIAASYDADAELQKAVNKVKVARRKTVTKQKKDELLTKLESLKLKLHNESSIRNILINELKEVPKNQKWILFCKDITELKNADDLLYAWFGIDIGILSVTCDDSSKKVDSILENFNTLKEGVHILKCVDMMNEGVHIDGITGIIMLRKTESPNLFLQQLGRVLETGSCNRPIVLDIMNNFKNLTSYMNSTFNMLEDITNQVYSIADMSGVALLEEPIIVKNYTKDIVDVLVEVDKALNLQKWTQEEDDYLVLNYPKCGADCFDFLTNRTVSACKQRVSFLCINKENTIVWKEEELKKLEKYAPYEGMNVVRHFLDKSKKACELKAKENGWWFYRYFNAGDINKLLQGVTSYGVLDAYKIFEKDKQPKNQASCLYQLDKLYNNVDWNLVDKEVRKIAGMDR